jgi:4-carboxymuconolactone decarboxylase
MSSNSSIKSAKEAHAAGLKVLSDLGWPADSGFADMDARFWEFTTGHLFGQVWSRPGLSLRDRALVTLSVLLAVDADRGSMNHLRYAHNLGITEEEIRELIIQVGFYAGWPKGAHAMARFTKILSEPNNGFGQPKTKAPSKSKSQSKSKPGSTRQGKDTSKRKTQGDKA